MKNNVDIRKIKIISCGINDCGADWHWDTGERGFNEYDLWTVFRGRGVLSVGGVKWDARTGDSLLIPPGNRCVGEQDLEDRLLTINVHFHFIENAAPFFPFSGGAIRRRISDVSFMRDVLYRVIQLYNSAKTELAEAVFSSALVEFFEQGEPALHSYGSDKDTLVRSICDEINTSPADIPCLPEIAKKHGYSPDYIGRVFSAVAGIPISEYISNARINQAKLLLSSTSMTADEIAASLGFYDSCYFSRRFKKQTGCTPTEYRKSKLAGR
ncbi:MAG: helix-turn-helix domain-containing protein [Clostridia bacterium]|nr:helix-turn-helix domain-containing protein [Clostridia bacterium]